MITRAILFSVLLLSPTAADATTAADLQNRIIIDGVTSDYEADEWVLDQTTSVPERPRDSRWGEDNDLTGIALTWDNRFLYIAVPATTVHTELMLFIDTMCGGVSDLAGFEVMPRNVVLGSLNANFIGRVTRLAPSPRMFFVDCDNPVNVINADRVASVYRQDGNGPAAGALEIAIPWDALGTFVYDGDRTWVPTRGHTLGIVAAVTAGGGGGAGDAGPDPNVVLENDSTRVAVLNNHIRIPLDADEDGVLDLGVSPRASAVYTNGGMPSQSQVLPISLAVAVKVFAPDNGEVAEYRVSLVPDAFTGDVYLTARVYSASGRLVRRLLESEPRPLAASSSVDEWDGRDDQGNVVPGGIYILAVSGAAAPGAPATPAKAAVAVIR